MSTRWILLVVPNFLVALSLAAASPVLQRIEPVGAQRGKALRLDIYGTSLADGAEIISDLPATFTPLTPEARRMGPALSYLVEIKADAKVGLYPIRLETPTGLSNLVLFSIGEFPETAEEEAQAPMGAVSNDTVETAQAVDLPATINGRLSGPDRDTYRFSAKAGQRVTLEVEARRAGSAVDPVLRVMDAEGRQVAINNDAAAIGIDSRLSLRVQKSGVYYAEVHDARYSNQSANFYRLKIGEFDFAEGVFPLGGRRGEKVEVEWFGGSFDRPVSGAVDLTAVKDEADWVMARVPGRPGALPIPFAVGDHEEEMEARGLTLAPGKIVNGRISDVGEVDSYKLPVEAGQSWRIGVNAAELGSSALIPLLSVYDGDELIARSGDEIPEKRTTSLEENTEVSRDPFIHLEIPEGVQELSVVVEDLVQRGGPDFGYRLLAEQGPPDFELSLNTPHVNIPAGGVAYVSATALRRGFGGPIQLMVDNLPPGVTAEGGHISRPILTKDLVGVSSSGTLVLRAAADARAQSLQLSVFGEGQLPDGEIVRRRASGPGLVTAVKSRAGIRARERPARADWLGAELPAAVGESVPASLAVVGPSTVRIVKGTEYPLRWKLDTDDPAIKGLREFRMTTAGARETTFSPRDPEAERHKDGSYIKYLRTTMGGPEQKFDVTLTAEVRIGSRTERLSSPVITIEVVEGFKILPAEETFSAALGQSFTLAGRLPRDGGFDKEITVRAEDLPKGVACGEATASDGTDGFELQCQAATDAELGEHEIRLTGASVMAGRGEGKNVPYQVEPVPVDLKVVKR